MRADSFIGRLIAALSYRDSWDRAPASVRVVRQGGFISRLLAELSWPPAGAPAVAQTDLATVLPGATANAPEAKHHRDVWPQTTDNSRLEPAVVFEGEGDWHGQAVWAGSVGSVPTGPPGDVPGSEDAVSDTRARDDQLSRIGHTIVRALRHAEALDRALTSALGRDSTYSLARTFDLAYALSRADDDPARALDLANDLDPALARAHAAADLRAHALAGALSPAVTLARDPAFADDPSFAHDLAVVLTRLRRYGRVLATHSNWEDVVFQRVDAWLQMAYDILRRTSDNNLSGHDLSDIDLSALDLTGLLWSTATIWPEGMKEEIRERSEEWQPGMFQIVSWDGSAPKQPRPHGDADNDSSVT